MGLAMMTRKNTIPEGAEDAFRALLGSPPNEEKGEAGTYRWQKMAGGRFRARCNTPKHGLMTWAMKIDPRYGVQVNKHTERNGQYVVDYLGRPVQMWHCVECEKAGVQNWVIK